MSKAQQPFWLGGASASMAACFTHPLDRTKYCMQVLASKQPMLKAMHTFALRDGVPSLWSGLSASILRQTTYSTARFALYDLLARQVQQRSGSRLTSAETIMCAGLAGGLAGMVGNPTEVVLVRMCSDGVKDVPQRYRYPNALAGLLRIGKEEGMGAFTKGLGPNIVRSILMNVSQIAVYSSAKHQLLSNNIVKLHEGVPVHIAASLIAGTVATTVCAPADVLKSRLQSATSAKGGSQGVLKIITSAIRNEGPGVLMKGWTPAWLRLAPNTVLMFIFMEQLQKIFAARSTL